MFSSTLADASKLLAAAKNNLRLVEFLSGDTAGWLHANTMKSLKGVTFVFLYAAIEKTVTSCVVKALEEMDSSRLAVSEFKSILLCVVLDAELKALRECGTSLVWEKRRSLMAAILERSGPVKIDSNVFPSAGSMNISAKEVESIWYFFNVEGSSYPEGVNYFLLNEVKEKRNAIAHGRLAAEDVGERYTLDALEVKYDQVESFCLHFILAFEDYCKKKNYLKSSRTIY